MSYSLLFEKKKKKNELKAYREEILPLELLHASVIQDGVKHGQMRFIHSSTGMRFLAMEGYY